MTLGDSGASGSEGDSTLTLTVGWFIGSVFPDEQHSSMAIRYGYQAEPGPWFEITSSTAALNWCAPKTTGNTTIPAQMTANEVAVLIRETTGPGFGLAVHATFAKHETTMANNATTIEISAIIFTTEATRRRLTYIQWLYNVISLP